MLASDNDGEVMVAARKLASIAKDENMTVGDAIARAYGSSPTIVGVARAPAGWPSGKTKTPKRAHPFSPGTINTKQTALPPEQQYKCVALLHSMRHKLKGWDYDFIVDLYDRGVPRERGYSQPQQGHIRRIAEKLMTDISL